VTGIESKTVIDATNLVAATPPDGFASNSEYIKSRTAGPTANHSASISLRSVIGSARRQPGKATCGAAAR
jgi:hypothetical protein